MAKAKTFTRTITRKVKEQVPNYVELNLTPEEAEYLHTILGGHIIGEGPLRNLSRGIYEALNQHVDGYDFILGGAFLNVSKGYK